MTIGKNTGENYVKKVIALQNKTAKEIAEEIDILNAGSSQRVIATMWNRVSPDGQYPAQHDVLIFYEVDFKALAYVNKGKVKLPNVGTEKQGQD